MDYLKLLLSNTYLNAAVTAWVTAQLLKVLLIVLVQKRFDPKRFVGAGGMPSSHSATVCALAISVMKQYGFASSNFAFVAIFACIVMYDAAGVRRAAGEQAKILNKMKENWNGNSQEAFEKNLNEFLGHTPFQVAAGALLGGIIGWLM